MDKSRSLRFTGGQAISQMFTRSQAKSVRCFAGKQSRRLLTLVLETEGIEDLILLGFGLSWHWDTVGLGLTRASYRSMLTTFLASFGFVDCPTTEGNLCLDPFNVLFARLGTHVSPKMTVQFYNSLFMQ